MSRSAVKAEISDGFPQQSVCILRTCLSLRQLCILYNVMLRRTPHLVRAEIMQVPVHYVEIHLRDASHRLYRKAVSQSLLRPAELCFARRRVHSQAVAMLSRSYNDYCNFIENVVDHSAGNVER